MEFSGRGASPTGEPKRVAVLGFFPVGKQTGGAAAENLGDGVTDPLEGALYRRGLTVCERRDIALVLSEHRLIASGQTAGAAWVIHRRLPAVDYLLNGTVDREQQQGLSKIVHIVCDLLILARTEAEREKGQGWQHASPHHRLTTR